ncbi:MAG: hypothetical protein U5L96_07160 [Owenweeksia sp.]|nr:hypothetical protein [Owenweeksia sp.]
MTWVPGGADYGKYPVIQLPLAQVRMASTAAQPVVLPSYEASGAREVNTGRLISPAIDLSSVTSDAELSFWMHAYGADMGTLRVGVGTSASGPFTNVFTWSGQFQTSGSDPWANVLVQT